MAECGSTRHNDELTHGAAHQLWHSLRRQTRVVYNGGTGGSKRKGKIVPSIHEELALKSLA